MRGDYYASDDGDPGDGQHGTFYPMLNTPRVFARTPFFAEANLEDSFVSVTGEVGKKLAPRSDYHHLLWFHADGPYQRRLRSGGPTCE